MASDVLVPRPRSEFFVFLARAAASRLRGGVEACRMVHSADANDWRAAHDED